MPSPFSTVLLLEDDADVLDATTLLLEGEGFCVRSTLDLEAAIAIARECPDAVVLLDLSVAANVAEFIASLHAVRHWSGEVLLFSAGDRLHERAIEVGADGAVAKPFDIDDLVRRLRMRCESETLSPPSG